MGTESIQVSAVIPASPERVYAAWLDSAAHSAMTGGPAEIDPTVGGQHRAWDGYISGVTRELDPGRRIVQSWRSAEFPEGSADSQIVVTLAPEGEHTRITLDHTEIPEGQGSRYLDGWHTHYFTPMQAYFSQTAEALAAAARDAESETVKEEPAEEAAPAKDVAPTKRAAPAKRAAAKKAAPRKKAAAKKAAPRKKAAAKKAAPAKKAAKKAAPAKKAAAKKAAPAKKAAAKKAAPAKRAAAKKATAKKAAPAKKATARSR